MSGPTYRKYVDSIKETAFQPGYDALLACDHERWVSGVEKVGNQVACADCGYKWRAIVALDPVAQKDGSTHG